MRVALGEYEAGVSEIPGAKNFEQEFLFSLSQNHPRYTLLNWNKVDRQITKRVVDLEGESLMRIANPTVSKYLQSTHLKVLTKLVNHKNGTHEWRMQAWCAAFVNWCLLQSDVKPLGSATAAAWLKFGNAVLHPHRGAIVVLKPSPAWEVQGGSGHVAFFGGREGGKIWILGGNQGRKVCWEQKSHDQVRGFRWPKAVLGDFPVARGRTMTA
jgi:uncharacterized protein (TIGR02594 family)